VFHDVTSGNNSVPGLTGFSAGAGYDLATGLGSVDATLLVNHWKDSTVLTPAFQIAASPASVYFTQGTTSSVSLASTVVGGFNAAVSLSAGTLPTGLTATFSPAGIAAPGSGSAKLTLAATAKIPAGTYNLSLSANGGGVTQTVPLAVTILQACSYSINPVQATPAAAAGSYSFAVTAPAGCTWTASTSTNWISIKGSV
jgi:hypothetical protein